MKERKKPQGSNRIIGPKTSGSNRITKERIWRFKQGRKGIKDITQYRVMNKGIGFDDIENAEELQKIKP